MISTLSLKSSSSSSTSTSSSLFGRAKSTLATPIDAADVQQFLTGLVESSYWNVEPLVRFFGAAQRLLYATGSVCPRCAVVDRRGVRLSPARVVQRINAVYLIIDK
jgi:hypothetical protein